MIMDIIKGKTTIGELANLPNRYIHHYYRENYKKWLEIQKNPNGPQAKQAQEEALVSELTGV